MNEQFPALVAALGCGRAVKAGRRPPAGSRRREGVLDEGDDLAGDRHAGDLAVVATLGDATDVGFEELAGLLGGLEAAQPTSFEPCLVIRPLIAVVSDSRWVGVSPAHEHRCRAEGNLVTSPISATKIAPSTGPTPGMA